MAPKAWRLVEVKCDTNRVSGDWRCVSEGLVSSSPHASFEATCEKVTRPEITCRLPDSPHLCREKRK